MNKFYQFLTCFRLKATTTSYIFNHKLYFAKQKNILNTQNEFHPPSFLIILEISKKGNNIRMLVAQVHNKTHTVCYKPAQKNHVTQGNKRQHYTPICPSEHFHDDRCGLRSALRTVKATNNQPATNKQHQQKHPYPECVPVIMAVCVLCIKLNLRSTPFALFWHAIQQQQHKKQDPDALYLRSIDKGPHIRGGLVTLRGPYHLLSSYIISFSFLLATWNMVEKRPRGNGQSITRPFSANQDGKTETRSSTVMGNFRCCRSYFYYMLHSNGNSGNLGNIFQIIIRATSKKSFKICC